MQITPLSSYLGAEVRGVDLETIDAEGLEAINRVFLKHSLVVFKDQALSPKNQLRFSEYFGPLDTHPLTQYNHPDHQEIFVLSNETKDGKPLGIMDGGSYWHSDFAFREKPAKATVLNAQRLPSEGGNTLFVNMYQTYDDLDDALKTRLVGLKAIHRYRKRATVPENGTSVQMSAQQLAATPDVAHPIVRTHPETGLKALFVHPGITVEIEGMSQNQGQELLITLFDHCIQQKYQYAHRWFPGDVVMWDNRCLMHRATTRDQPTQEYRTIYRTTIMGDRPL